MFEFNTAQQGPDGAMAAVRTEYKVPALVPWRGLPGQAAGGAAAGTSSNDWAQLARRVISSGFRPTFLVAMWRGGAPIGIAVQEVLEYHSIHVDHIAIRTSSYTGIDKQAKSVRVHAIDYLVSRLTAEDQLLLVDDVFDSGRSLEAAIAELKSRCRRNFPERYRIATVYYKSSRNRSSLLPDYYVLDTDKWLVFPHELVGLTKQEILEHKPVTENFFLDMP
jgi:hypoxanthine phosphoribosyltransferase